MVRKHLHFSWEEWESLPWWQCEAYYEQIQEDLRSYGPEGTVTADVASTLPQQIQQPVDDELPDRLKRFDVNAVPRDPDDLSAFGINVITVN